MSWTFEQREDGYWYGTHENYDGAPDGNNHLMVHGETFEDALDAASEVGAMTVQDKILALLDNGDVTTELAARVTKTTQNHCQKQLYVLMGEGRAYRSQLDNAGSGVTWVYTKDPMGARVDLGGLRGMMITKAWRPGELRL